MEEGSTKIKKDHFDVKDAMDYLLNRFRIERYIYLFATILSIVLLAILVYGLLRKGDYKSVLIMLGPTGLITFSFSRLLKMWTDCIEILKIYMQNQSKNE